MLRFVGRRTVWMLLTLVAISFVTFVVIKLPPGDYTTTVIANAEAQGRDIPDSQIAELKRHYGLDKPFMVQYLTWIGGVVLHGDLGQSFAWNQSVSSLIGSRVLLSIVLSLASLLFVWAIAFPIGIYSALRQYSSGDYIASFLGFIGMAVPEFMLALVMMYVGFRYFGQSVGGLFSPQYADAAWNLGKLLDLLSHLWIPIVVVGVAGTAGLIRITRANLLDELHKPYVATARAKGLPEWKLLLKYPVRMSLSPFFSTVGWLLPGLISGETIVSVVMSLPTSGPLLLGAVKSQDMYLVGSFVLILSTLTVIGTMLSDLALAWWDPRIRTRFQKG
ncbi:ABC transporter permease [Kribbella sp. NPDC048928]|jgi:peptide/nickel transport system permease protein|uniref:ABC transporter permease n=1 Tax=Kribbella sp. NPDC048928 TaxID=3364111 RepID=UPI0037135CFA